MLIDFDVKRLTTNVLNFVRVTTINLNKPEIFGASVVFPHSKDNRVMLLMAGKKTIQAVYRKCQSYTEVFPEIEVAIL